ncbi:MAG: hypothetical protein ACOY3P_05980 [Planctomycetota bacterium]
MDRAIYDDPVVAEVHAIRQALLDECGGDVDEYRRQVRNRQATSSRRIVRSPLTRPAEEAGVHGRQDISKSG